MTNPQAHWTSRSAAWTAPPRRRDLLENELDGQLILVDPIDGRTHRLNPTALDVWRQCDGGTTTRQIADRQVRRYDVDPDDALDHVEQLVVKLAESNLLEIPGGA
jgi:hypothetical protein